MAGYKSQKTWRAKSRICFKYSFATQFLYWSYSVAAIDIDGADGSTNIAGELLDNSTMERVKEKDFNIFGYLVKHGASRVLLSSDDAVITRATGTNTNDFKILLMS